MAHNIGILAGQHSGERTVDPALSTVFPAAVGWDLAHEHARR